MRPLLQVGRSIETYLSVHRPCGDHDPSPGRLVPEHFGIAEISLTNVQHGIPRKFRPGASAIVTVSDVLVLERLRCVMPCVDGNERRLAVLSEAAAIVPIDDCAPGEDHYPVLLGQRDRQ